MISPVCTRTWRRLEASCRARGGEAIRGHVDRGPASALGTDTRTFHGGTRLTRGPGRSVAEAPLTRAWRWSRSRTRGRSPASAGAAAQASAPTSATTGGARRRAVHAAATLASIAPASTPDLRSAATTATREGTAATSTFESAGSSGGQLRGDGQHHDQAGGKDRKRVQSSGHGQSSGGRFRAGRCGSRNVRGSSTSRSRGSGDS